VRKIENTLVVGITVDRAHEAVRDPDVSFNAFAMGARQFVVQLALETILSFLDRRRCRLRRCKFVTSGLCRAR